ncbi:MAG: SUF system NifU family Fe-S cluster assembly protein [Pseudomonadota bacterium]|nr:SUF system NifU family Fe-S cluster assembly protein [Pseudomonadota bacterium]
MFDELREMYQEVILDHGKNPRNFRRLDEATCLAHGNNPVCGDTLVIYLILKDDEEILDVTFQGQGCAISIASASIMTEILIGKTLTEARRLFDGFHDMCTKDDFDFSQINDCDEDSLERLSILSGVKDFPIRVKCATLAWHTMQAAVNGEETISTE